MEHDFFGRSSGKFPGRSYRTFQKVVLERPKKAVPNVFHFFKTIFNLFLIPVSRVGRGGGGGEWYTSIPEKNSPKYPIAEIQRKWYTEYPYLSCNIPYTRFKKPLYTAYPKTLADPEFQAFATVLREMELICTNGKHDSERKFASPESCLPFALIVNRPVCRWKW